QVEPRFGPRRLRLRLRDRVDEDLEATERARNVERFERLRMELAERAEHNLRAELDRARATGMVPAGATRLDLQLVDRRAAGLKRGKGIGLGVEDADGCGIAGPMTAL